MPSKIMVAIGLGVGSTIGGYVPYLWGDTGFLSFGSVICSIIGGGIGLFVVVKMARMME